MDNIERITTINMVAVMSNMSDKIIEINVIKEEVIFLSIKNNDVNSKNHDL